MKRIVLGLMFCTALALSACADDDGDDVSEASSDDVVSEAGSMPSAAVVDDQTPPMGAAALQAWLDAGMYKGWTAEPEVHPSRAPSPHGFNRIYVNDLLAEEAQGSGDWPAGVAAVKELYESMDGEAPIGYAVYLKTADESAGGDNWYWYEVVPTDHPAPHDENGVVADGMGDNGPAKTICVGCHVAAGADAEHTPTVGGRDQVYTPL